MAGAAKDTPERPAEEEVRGWGRGKAALGGLEEPLGHSPGVRAGLGFGACGAVPPAPSCFGALGFCINCGWVTGKGMGTLGEGGGGVGAA